jgi:hypothetical protein
MIEADAPSTEEAALAHRVGARPTGDSHGRTTRGPAQRGEGLGHRGGVERRAGGWSSDPMIEADVRARRCCRYRLAWCARPTGDRYVRTTDAPAQRFRGAMRRPRQGGAPEKRGQGHCRGWGPTPSFELRCSEGVLSFARIATTLLHERLPWVTTSLYPTASERGECMLALCSSSGYSQRWRW